MIYASVPARPDSELLAQGDVVIIDPFTRLTSAEIETIDNIDTDTTIDTLGTADTIDTIDTLDTADTIDILDTIDTMPWIL